MAEVPHKLRLRLNSSTLQVKQAQPVQAPTLKKSVTKMAIRRPPTTGNGNSFQYHKEFAMKINSQRSSRQNLNLDGSKWCLGTFQNDGRTSSGGAPGASSRASLNNSTLKKNNSKGPAKKTVQITIESKLRGSSNSFVKPKKRPVNQYSKSF